MGLARLACLARREDASFAQPLNLFLHVEIRSFYMSVHSADLISKLRLPDHYLNEEVFRKVNATRICFFSFPSSRGDQFRHCISTIAPKIRLSLGKTS